MRLLPQGTRVLALLLGTLLCGGTAVAAQQGRTAGGAATGTVTGRVVDPATGAPVVGAVVRLPDLERRTISGVDGMFTLVGIPVGEHGAMISRLGHQTVTAAWAVTGAGLEVEVRLPTERVVLEELRVAGDRFRGRAPSTAYSLRSFGPEVLARSLARDAADFVKTRAGMMMTSCGARAQLGDGPGDCVSYRGSTVRPCIVVDERPAFARWDELSMYSPQDIYSVDVIAGGSVIQVYTVQYARSLAQRQQRPILADVLTSFGCSGR